MAYKGLALRDILVTIVGGGLVSLLLLPVCAAEESMLREGPPARTISDSFRRSGLRMPPRIRERGSKPRAAPFGPDSRKALLLSSARMSLKCCFARSRTDRRSWGGRIIWDPGNPSPR